MWFEASSSLKINLDKSEMYSIGAVENMDLLDSELGYLHGHLLATFLGLPWGPLLNL